MATSDDPRMSPEELHARRAQGEEIVVLDVRTEDALRVYPYHIPGVRWLPLATVVQQAETLPRQGMIVTY